LTHEKRSSLLEFDEENITKPRTIRLRHNALCALCK